MRKRLGRYLRWLKPLTRLCDLWDLTAAGGVLLLAVGLWCYSPPLCLVCIGLGLVGLATLAAHGQARATVRQPPDPGPPMTPV